MSHTIPVRQRHIFKQSRFKVINTEMHRTTGIHIALTFAGHIIWLSTNGWRKKKDMTALRS